VIIGERDKELVDFDDYPEPGGHETNDSLLSWLCLSMHMLLCFSVLVATRKLFEYTCERKVVK
jgi:hypothetical protein